MNGTVFTESDYQVQSAAGFVPPPRAFHASASFQNLLWLTGGRTTPRGNYNTRLTDRLGDVWYSQDGDLWTQVVRLTGDFAVQESDAVQPGPHAPWWARYGHTLTTLDVNGDGHDDMMVLMVREEGSVSHSVRRARVCSQGACVLFCGSLTHVPHLRTTSSSLNSSPPTYRLILFAGRLCAGAHERRLGDVHGHGPLQAHRESSGQTLPAQNGWHRRLPAGAALQATANWPCRRVDAPFVYAAALFGSVFRAKFPPLFPTPTSSPVV